MLLFPSLFLPLFFQGRKLCHSLAANPRGGRINTKAMRNPPSPFPLFLFPSSSEGNSSRFPPLFFPLLLSLFRLESLRSQSVATSFPAKLREGEAAVSSPESGRGKGAWTDRGGKKPAGEVTSHENGEIVLRKLSLSSRRSDKFRKYLTVCFLNSFLT